jgi:hypothetical protein
LQILVGQNAPNTSNRINQSSSGGGGSFVTQAPHNTNASILVIAGGGGGTMASQDASAVAITGGTIEGVELTLAEPNLTDPILNGDISGNAFLDEDNMVSNSDTKVASQQSIKAYIDSGVVTMSNKTLMSPKINEDVELTATATKLNDLASTTVNAAHLNTFEQTPDPISAIVLAAQAEGNPAVPIDISVVGAGDLLRMNGNPKWRGFSSLNWRKNNWGAGIRANYVSDLYETSVNVAGEPMGIPSWSTVDVFLDYRFREGVLDGSRVRVGARNIGNEDPPIADESFGYFSNVHSNRGRYWYLNYTYSF